MSATKTMVIARRGKVAQAIEESGYSFRELERATNVSRSTIQSIEGGIERDGKPYGVSVEKAEALAKALKKPVGALFVHKNGDPLSGS